MFIKRISYLLFFVSSVLESLSSHLVNSLNALVTSHGRCINCDNVLLTLGSDFLNLLTSMFASYIIHHGIYKTLSEWHKLGCSGDPEYLQTIRRHDNVEALRYIIFIFF